MNFWLGILKKSDIYRIAQEAVLKDDDIRNDCKLKILRELMAAEELAAFSEAREREQAEQEKAE